MANVSIFGMHVQCRFFKTYNGRTAALVTGPVLKGAIIIRDNKRDGDGAFHVEGDVNVWGTEFIEEQIAEYGLKFGYEGETWEQRRDRIGGRADPITYLPWGTYPGS